MTTKGTPVARISTDQWLGMCGCSLAIAAATFGVYMTVHGPTAPPAVSRDFTIFAQLAPRVDEPMRTHGPSTNEDLDTTATASIGKPGALEASSDMSAGPEAADHVLAGIVLRAADREIADVVVDGRLRKVRVGDMIPGAGEVLAILPGRRPLLKTSLGLIVPAR